MAAIGTKTILVGDLCFIPMRLVSSRDPGNCLLETPSGVRFNVGQGEVNNNGVHLDEMDAFVKAGTKMSAKWALVMTAMRGRPPAGMDQLAMALAASKTAVGTKLIAAGDVMMMPFRLLSVRDDGNYLLETPTGFRVSVPSSDVTQNGAHVDDMDGFVTAGSVISTKFATPITTLKARKLRD